MASTVFILEMIKKNNGVITAAEVTKTGISCGNLKYMVDTGLLERIARAYINWLDHGKMKYIIFKLVIKEGFSLVLLPFIYLT